MSMYSALSSVVSWASLHGVFMAVIFNESRQSCKRPGITNPDSRSIEGLGCGDWDGGPSGLTQVIGHDPGIRLSILLASFGGQECAQLHDKVYAVLGLHKYIGTSQELPTSLQPDYRKDPHRVLLEATRYHILHEMDVVIDAFVAKRSPTAQRLPSWARDWTRKDPSRYDGTVDNYDEDIRNSELLFEMPPPHLRADGSGKLRMLTDAVSEPDLHILSLEGVPIVGTTVAHCSPRIETLSGLVAYLMATHDLDSCKSLTIHDLLEILTAGEHGDDLAEPGNDLLNILFAGKHRQKFTDSKNAIDGEACLLKYCEGKESLASDLDFSESQWQAMLDDVFPPHDQHISESMFRYCQHRCLFTTDGGRLVLGPRTVEVGDEVVVLAGCSLPVVVRPHGSQFSVVGPAYVKGIMQGEAVDAYLASGRAPRIYNLI